MKRALAVILCLVLAAIAAPARAQSAATTEEWRALGDGVIALETAGAAAPRERKATVRVRQLDAKLAPRAAPVTVHDAGAVIATLAVRPGAAAVLLYRAGRDPRVQVALVDLAAGTSRLVDLPRTAPSGYAPTAAVACGDPDGFALLWQEQKVGDPGAEAHATLARIRPDGTFVQKAAAVAVPWSLAAIIDDGRGYTLALYYDGAAPDRTRLCFVTLTRDGKPEQHPWWGSRPGLVDEVQLAQGRGAIVAAYRTGGGAIVSVVANETTGQWGKEADPSRVLVPSASPPAPGARGETAAGAPPAFALRVVGDAPEILRR